MALKYVQAGGQLNKYLKYELDSITLPSECVNNCQIRPWQYAYGNPQNIIDYGIVINNTTFNNVVFGNYAFSSQCVSKLAGNFPGIIYWDNHDITINYDSTMDNATAPTWIGDYCFENDQNLNSITINITEDIETGATGKVLCGTQAFRSVLQNDYSRLNSLYFNLRPIKATKNRFKIKSLNSMGYLTNLDLTYLYSADSTTELASNNNSLLYIYSPTAIIKSNGSAFKSNPKVKEIFHTELYINDADSNFGTVGVGSFSGSSSLTALIIYGDGQNVLPLYNTNYFSTCYHILGTYNATYNPDTLHDGYIYVPDSLVNSYKAASNWGTYASQIKGLSEYPASGHFYTQVQALINGTLLS